MLKRPHYIALGLILGLTLIILNLPARTTAQLKLGIGSVFLPLLGLNSASQELAGQAGDALLTRRQLLNQVDDLRRQNAELWPKAARAEELARENDRLRRYVGWQQSQPWKLKLAKVILRDPANWWRTAQIDVGSRDGVRTNMPVLAPDGALVGRISSVSLTRSQVLFLGDPNCKVAVHVENESRDSGVIVGSGPLDGDLVEMRYLSVTANLKPGQKVITIGDGGVFPANINVGQVVDSRATDNGLGEVARVKLAANLNTLEEVWVRLE